MFNLCKCCDVTTLFTFVLLLIFDARQLALNIRFMSQSQSYSCEFQNQDSWEDEDEEPKEEEKPADEAQVVKKTKPQKNLKKQIEEKEVSEPQTFCRHIPNYIKLIRFRCFSLCCSAIEAGRGGGEST